MDKLCGKRAVHWYEGTKQYEWREAYSKQDREMRGNHLYIECRFGKETLKDVLERREEEFQRNLIEHRRKGWL